MRVWVTRTEPGASRLGARLVDAGFDAWVRPVLAIEPISAPPPGRSALTVFLSAHAVEFAVRNGWKPTPALAIGKATLRALARRGIDARTPDRSSSEGIIAAFAADPPQSVLIAAGEGGRDVLEQWLIRRGIPVVKWCLYRRVAVSGSLAPAEAIDAIVGSSAAALQVVANMWFASSRSANVAMLVPSERVAQSARDLGFARVFVTDGAGDEAVVAALDGVERQEPSAGGACPTADA